MWNFCNGYTEQFAYLTTWVRMKLKLNLTIDDRAQLALQKTFYYTLYIILLLLQKCENQKSIPFSFLATMNTTLTTILSSPSLGVTETSKSSNNDALKIYVTVFLVIIITVTIIGNGLVCLGVYRQPQLKGVHYYPILSLAFADILCGVCAMPAYIAKKHISGGIKERITCDVFRFTYFFSVYASVLSLTVISLERLIAIKMPVRHRMLLTKRKMISVLLISWFDAVLVSMLPFIWRRGDTEELCTYRPSKEWSIMAILLNVCFPFVIMFVCHIYTVYFAIQFSRAKYKAKSATLVRIRQNTSEHQNSQEDRERILLKRERDITCTMAIVLGAFILCWAPSSLYYFLQMVCPHCYGPSFEESEPVFNAVVKLLTFLNSCLNPVIYCWMNKHFRQAFYLSLLQKSEARKRRFTNTYRMQGKTENSCGL